MKQNSFRGPVDADGNLTLWNAGGYKALLKHYAGKQVVLTIGQHKPDRSSNQNRYYFGVVVKTLADELGYTADEMHHALAYKFLRLEAEPEGRILETVRSTAKLNTAEFEDYLDRIRMWAGADLGITIPLPNEF